MYQRSLCIGVTVLMVVVALLGLLAGAPAGAKGTGQPPAKGTTSGRLYVQIDDLQRVALDEVAARFHDVTHQR